MERPRRESGVLFEAGHSEAEVNPQSLEDGTASLPKMGEIYSEFEEREGFLLARLGIPYFEPTEST